MSIEGFKKKNEEGNRLLAKTKLEYSKEIRPVRFGFCLNFKYMLSL